MPFLAMAGANPMKPREREYQRGEGKNGNDALPSSGHIVPISRQFGDYEQIHHCEHSRKANRHKRDAQNPMGEEPPKILSKARHLVVGPARLA